VAGDYLHILRHQGEDLLQSCDHPADTAATADVHKGEPVRDEIVSHMHDIGFGKKDHGIAIGMAIWDVYGADIFSVHVNRRAIIESHDGQGFLWRRSDAVAANGPTFLQPFANVIVRNDGGFRSKRRVAPGVIAMKMSIDNKPEGLIGDPLEGLFYLWSERSELVVHNDNPVLADRNANVAARSFEHVNAP